jgi:hypothetical protein
VPADSCHKPASGKLRLYHTPLFPASWATVAGRVEKIPACTMDVWHSPTIFAGPGPGSETARDQEANQLARLAVKDLCRERN